MTLYRMSDDSDIADSLARAAGGRLDIGHNALTLHLRSANSKTEAGLEAQQGE